MFYTTGIDVGNSSIKAVLMRFNDDGSGGQMLGHEIGKIRKRDPKDVISQTYAKLLAAHKLQDSDVAYCATTGEGDMVDFRRGHFYSMTCHARGALYLDPEARAVVDAGALHAKALIMDERSKVLQNRMTSQCASGSGQFIENISRYLGITIDDVGKLSVAADKPEVVSGICAVLAETDVINMVSRGISASNILKGIHLSMGRRLINLLRLVNAKGRVIVTGGLALDEGLIAAMREIAADDKKFPMEIVSHPLSPFAGAIGCAFWAGFRHVKLRDAA